MRSLVAAPSLVLVFLVACGSSTPPPSKTAARTEPPASTAPPIPEPVRSKTVISRADVKVAVKRGLGSMLQHVTLADEPVMRKGAFVGFRLRSLDPALAAADGPAPGDVVTKVNGFSLEHPEDALTAFKSLEVASELVVSYERDGQPREFRAPIAE